MQPALVEFKYDEAHITGLALDLTRGGALPLLSGGTTLGIQRAALDVYLLALPLKLGGGHVEAALWFLGALGVIAVALTYRLGRQIGGAWVGLLAALFMAANPWLVFFDRKLWAHIQVLFSVMLLLLAWQGVVAGRRRAALWFPIVAALQLLAHVLALVQALSWLGALVSAPRRWLRREFAWGSAIGGLLLAPYLWALAQRGGMRLAAPAGSVPSPAQALADAQRLLTGDGIQVLAALPRAASPWWQAMGQLALPVLILSGLGLLRMVWQARGGKTAAGARLLLAWTLGPTVLLAIGPLQPPLQYWTVLLPLPALYLALGLDWLRCEPKTFRVSQTLKIWGGRMTISVAALTLALVWTMAFADLLRAVDGGAGAVTFGAPLKRWEAATAAAQTWATELGTQEVRVAVNGVDPGYDSEPAIVAALIGNPPFARFVAPSSPPALLLAHDRPSLYLWTVDAPETETALRKIGAAVWEGTLTQGRPTARLYRLPAANAVDLGFQRLEPPQLFDAGLALIGYTLPDAARAGQPFQATLVWRVLDPPMAVRSRDLTAFNHILGADGAGVAQADGLALLSRDWWPGDVLIQPYLLELPAGVYRWRTGLYSRTDGGRSQLLTGGDAVDLPIFTVR